MKRALAIGAVTAVLLTFVRGGFADGPWVVLVFGLCGFFGSLSLSWLFRRETKQALQSFLTRLPSALRDVLALAVAASLLFWSGPVIISGGFGAWLVGLLFFILAPLPVCLVATRWSIAFGIVAATCITLSILFFEGLSGSFDWANFWAKDIGAWLGIWAIGAGSSLIVSVPIQLGRRKGPAEVRHNVPGVAPIVSQSSGNSMIRFSLSRWDLARCRLWIVCHNRPLVLLSLVIWAGVSLLALRSPDVAARPVAFKIVYVAFLAVFLLCATAVLQVVFHLLWVVFHKDRGQVGVHELEIRDDGLLVRTDVSESLHRWSGFHKIVSTHKYLFIFVTDSIVHYVPLRCFPSDEDAKHFREEIARRGNAV